LSVVGPKRKMLGGKKHARKTVLIARRKKDRGSRRSGGINHGEPEELQKRGRQDEKRTFKTSTEKKKSVKRGTQLEIKIWTRTARRERPHELRKRSKEAESVRAEAHKKKKHEKRGGTEKMVQNCAFLGLFPGTACELG